VGVPDSLLSRRVRLAISDVRNWLAGTSCIAVVTKLTLGARPIVLVGSAVVLALARSLHFYLRRARLGSAEFHLSYTYGLEGSQDSRAATTPMSGADPPRNHLLSTASAAGSRQPTDGRRPDGHEGEPAFGGSGSSPVERDGSSRTRRVRTTRSLTPTESVGVRIAHDRIHSDRRTPA